MSGLVITPVVDKNGKYTQVWKKPAKPSNIGKLSAIPPITKMSDPYWEDSFDSHDTITHKGRDWSVSPEGYSGAYCQKCGGFFTHDELDNYDSSATYINCSYCSYSTYVDLVGVAIDHDSLAFLDKEEVKKAVWYHVSVRDNWDTLFAENSDETPLVHVGTKKAALTRMQHLVDQRRTKQKFYLYEVTLSPDISVSDSLMEDDNDLAPKLVGEQIRGGYDTMGATRYVNGYEAIGSISLIVNPQKFRVVGKSLL